MGIDAHAIHLLRQHRRFNGPLGHTLTLGRQAVHLAPSAMRRLGIEIQKHGPYCESLLTTHFGATSVDSLDNSAYEGATIVADLNERIPVELEGRFDSILDFGCIEHVFDVAQVMQNISNMCKLGGYLLHILPANGFCGHGFYQFSPEFFFSYYSSNNGFAGTRVFLADPLDTRYWRRPPAFSSGAI